MTTKYENQQNWPTSPHCELADGRLSGMLLPDIGHGCAELSATVMEVFEHVVACTCRRQQDDGSGFCDFVGDCNRLGQVVGFLAGMANSTCRINRQAN